jgi:hypothetical protein
MATLQFANEFNELLQLAKDVSPTVEERLWPPALTIEGSHVVARYVEVEAYLNQIMNLVPHSQY